MSTVTKGSQKSRGMLFGVLKAAVLTPLAIVFWPLAKVWNGFYHHFLSYLIGRVVRDRDRIYRIRFVWYGDSIYLHPMIWGSLALFGLTAGGVVTAGWALLVWFVALFVCYITILYNFDIIRCSILATGIVAFFGMAHFATVEFAWNPLTAVADHVRLLDASVSPGFFGAAAYVFTALISAEVVWAWLFHRVEIDESYVYEHQFMKTSTREPIFARGLKRETRDILELILLGAGDIQHRTRKGYRIFKNVPFASLWLGTAIDSLLDFRRKGEIALQKEGSNEGADVRVSDANPELAEELEGDDFDSDDADDDIDDGDDGMDDEADDMS
ncbi:MAG: hypothetical protein ACKVII_09760 [Planctomycetales bacterium]|jgi:hypothetical protein